MPYDKKPYHHGDLSSALLRAAEQLVREQGPSELSLREVARRAGVSHGAPAHHFRDKAGLLTALATEGFVKFAEALGSARDAATGGRARFAATGVAYVLFARDHRAHFEIMWRPELLNTEDAALQLAKSVAYEVLLGAVHEAQAEGYAKDTPAHLVATRSWSISHGFAVLWLQGNFKHTQPIEDLETLARAIIDSYVLSDVAGDER